MTPEGELSKKIILAVAEFMRKHTVMLVIAKGKKNALGLLSNGTGFLIDTGTDKFLVTCRHVYEAYERAKEKDCDVYLAMVGEPVTDISDSVEIDRGKGDIDLITLHIKADVERLGKRYYEVRRWPPERPNIDDLAYFIGFPNEIRQLITKNEVEANILVFADFISSVSELHFGMADEKQERGREIYNVRLSNPASLSGISGSLVIREVSAGLSTFEPVGVVYEMQSNLADLILAHHLDFIEPDGKIRDIP